MLDVFKLFYSTHYNLAALSILLLLITIYLLTKKNLKIAPIFFAVLVALNVWIYKNTAGYAWTIELEPDKHDYSSDEYRQPEQLTFSATEDKWIQTDIKGKEYHWCWVEDLWEKFSNTDLVAWLWGDNASKKAKQSLETRIDEANKLGE